MALAETAQMIADLELKDHMSAPAKEAKASLQGLDQATEQTTTRVSTMGAVSARVSGSMGHFKDRVGNITKSIGILGLGGAVLATTKFLKDSIGEAQAFGDAVDKVATLTGMAVGQTSKFVDALGYFGIAGDKAQSIIGMYEKNLNTLGGTTKLATKFQKDYGFSLRDSSGHLKNAQEVVSSFVTFFNDKTVPMQQKAAAGAKLFGRSWQELLPIFQAGGKEWQKQLAAGMELTKEDIRNIRQARGAQREWNDALGDFKTMVGIHLLPVMSQLAKSAANWLNDPGNQKTLLGFLDQGIKLGKDLAGFLTGTVLPTLSNLAGTAKAFWDTLPKPLQDLLVTGLVADRTVKYLFGFSLTGVAGDVLKGVISDGIGGILGKLGFTRGSSPANPMYVAAVGGLGAEGGGGGGVVPGTAGGGTGIVSKLGRAVSIIGAVSIAGTSIAALAEQFGTFQQTTAAAQAHLQAQADAASQHTAQDALSQLKSLHADLGRQGIWERAIGDTFGGKQIADGLGNLADAVANNGKLNASQITDAITTLQGAQQDALARGNQKVADRIGADIRKLQGTTAQQGTKQGNLLTTLQRALSAPLNGANAKLGVIANKPTNISVTVPVSTSVSVRDTTSATHTTSRYGFQAS